ncbi:MAG: M23 family metallopeptidase [Leptospiraceae bacterium]|nr:M23 family metallopeptidase [Leptospiraceae bacterium]
MRLVLVFWISSALVAQSWQDLPVPLKIYLRISGSFGELRRGHLHRGVDLRTFGQNGLTVYNLAPGWVESIRGSSKNQGFGQAITIRHADGPRVTYAHLHRFWERKKLQLTFEIMEILHPGQSFHLIFPPKWIWVNPGEPIAFAGEKGSGVSHLHYEIEWPDGVFHNPISKSRYGNFDRSFPEIIAVSVDHDEVYPSSRKNSCRPQKEKEGFYRCSPLEVHGRFGFVIQVRDEFNSINPLSIQEAWLSHDQELLFHLRLDYFHFVESEKPEWLYDISKSSSSQAFYAVRLFFSGPGKPPSWIRYHAGGGKVDPTTWPVMEIHNYQIRVADLSQNVSVVEIPIRYRPLPPVPTKVSFPYQPGQKILYRKKDIELRSSPLEGPCSFRHFSRRPPRRRGLVAWGSLHDIRLTCASQKPTLEVCLFSPYKKRRGIYLGGSLQSRLYDEKRRAYCTHVRDSAGLYLADDREPPRVGVAGATGPLSKIQLYVPVSDAQSGVDQENVEVIFAGRRLTKKELLRWGVYYDKDRQAFVFPTGFEAEPRQDLAGIILPISLRAFDRSGNPSSYFHGLIEVAP